MDTLQNEKNYGQLVVQVSAAAGAVPIQNASVIIRAEDEDGNIRILGVLQTDESGITSPFAVPTPPLSQSLSPGGKKPYSEIITEVFADGYYATVNLNIPVYPGITSIQPVTLVPLPDSAYGTQPAADIVIHNDKQRPAL